MAVGLTLLSFTVHAESGIIDEMKLGVLDHDVPIGGDHRGCCIDVTGELPLAAPSFFDEFWTPRSDLGITINTEGKSRRSNMSLFPDYISDANRTQHNPGLTSPGMCFGFRF